MGRIRTIKPEFPQSESIGKLSRDARLLFIQLWTIVDDEGRARAASRMLASILYPYDDDASKLIDSWLDELESRRLIRRYEVDGSQYLEIVKWLEHQKIDKPSKSRLPPFVETSRNLANDQECSSADLGPRTSTKEEDLSRSVAAATRPSARSRFDEFWKAYPRRDGPNPQKPAEAKFNALVKSGLDPGMLIDEVKKFAAAETSRGTVGTRYIPQATKWLNEQRWADHAAVAALQAIRADPNPEQTLEKAVAFFAKTGIWARGIGNEPGLTGCRAPPEMLAKYGLGPDGRKLGARGPPSPHERGG